MQTWSPSPTRTGPPRRAGRCAAADPRRDGSARGRRCRAGRSGARRRADRRLPPASPRRRHLPCRRGARGRSGRHDGMRRCVAPRRRRTRAHRGAGRMTDPIDAARAILRQACGDRVRDDVPMAPRPTFRIGGPAARFVEPVSVDDLHAVARAASTTGVSVAIVGKGSNVLVADEGFRGIVVRLGGGFRWSARDGDVVTAGGALPLPAIAGVAQQHGLAGLGFGVAIPASLGGAIRMNAGAHDGQMADVVASVDMIELATDRIRAVPADEAGFAYRSTALPADAVIVAAKLRLRPGDPAEIRAAMDAARRWRRQTQPIAEPNCGSVFTNPPGQHAAALIDAAGLKGAAIGGASVSTKHANFIIAAPGATAADVRALIDLVRSGVSRASGIDLETEVRTIGGPDV